MISCPAWISEQIKLLKGNEEGKMSAPKMAGNELLKTKLTRIYKRQACRFFMLFCLGIGCSVTVSAQDSAAKANIAPNGSFEQESVSEGKPIPEGWWFPGQANITGAYITDGGQQVHSGKKAVSITIPAPADKAANAMWLSEPIEVKSGSAYSIEAWIKTLECAEGAPPKGAWLWVLGYTEKNGQVKGPGQFARPQQFFSGTQDWREYSVSIIIAKDIHWLRIACRLDGSGTAYFDDLVISKME
jgi:hypothetical protein